MASAAHAAHAVRQKWDLDDIIAPEKRDECADCVCGVCLGIWNDPVQIKSCHHIFCKSCVQDLPNPITICPVCRENVPAAGFEALQTSNKHALRRLNNLPVLCPFHKRKPAAVPGRVAEGQDGEPPLTRRRLEEELEPAEQCGWKGSYADLNKHMATCEWCLVLCPHGCGEAMRRPELEQHLPACLLNFHECSICHEKVRPTQKAEHDRSAAEQHVKILLNADQKKLQKLEQSLKNLEVSFDKRLESVVSEVRSSQLTDAVWVVKDMAAVLQQHPKGSALWSPRFRLGPAVDLRLKFLPNGDNESLDGWYALFVKVRGQCPYFLDLTLRVQERSKTMARAFAEGDLWGWSNFGWVSELPAEGDLEIFLDLNSARVLVTRP